MFAEEIAPLGERFPRQVLAFQCEEIEGVEDNRRGIVSGVLHQREAGPSLGIERHQFTVRGGSFREGQMSRCTQMPENALSGPDTAVNSRNLPSCLYSDPGQKAMHAKRIVSSLYSYPGQTLASTSSGLYVQ